jgi:phage FluMu protein Com
MIEEYGDGGVRCQCGAIMLPVILSNIIDYKCPKARLWNFWRHSINRAFLRNDTIGV